jgi:hypothetical protein
MVPLLARPGDILLSLFLNKSSPEKKVHVVHAGVKLMTYRDNNSSPRKLFEPDSSTSLKISLTCESIQLNGRVIICKQARWPHTSARIVPTAAQ